VVLPDNVLFEGGAGETIRKKLLHECDVHTLLRLPTGLFYAQGVKANVLFFEKKGASETPWTKQLWIYDLRTNKHFTLKTNPLARAPTLDEFVDGCTTRPKSVQAPKATWSEDEQDSADGRWRAYSYDELGPGQGQPGHLLAQGRPRTSSGFASAGHPRCTPRLPCLRRAPVSLRLRHRSRRGGAQSGCRACRTLVADHSLCGRATRGGRGLRCRSS
jgi:hypothetical protein